MKKLVAILVGAILLLSVFAKFSKPGVVEVVPAGQVSEPSQPVPAAGSTESFRPTGSGPQEPAVVATPPPVTAVVEQALREAPSRQELQRIYSSYKSPELRSHLKRSETFVTRHKLIERANSQQLKPAEIRALATELRRQDVIRYLLLSRQVARMKEKYL